MQTGENDLFITPPPKKKRERVVLMFASTDHLFEFFLIKIFIIICLTLIRGKREKRKKNVGKSKN